MSKIDELLKEVQRLKEQTEPADESGLVKTANQERDIAISQMNQAVKERNEAVAELAEVKAAVQWTMGKLLIKDVLFMRTDEMPAAAEGWLNGFGFDSEDTRRVAFINKHGRMRIGDNAIIIALPLEACVENETFPEIYNFRHFVDIARRTYRVRPLPLP